MPDQCLLARLTKIAIGMTAVLLPACASQTEDEMTSPPVGKVSSALVAPISDPFYVPPPGYESTAPGTVLRSRSVSVAGVLANSKQMLVRSTDSKGNPIAIVSTLMVPLTAWLFGNRPLVSYQPAIDSLGDQCEPSYVLQAGGLQELAIIKDNLFKNWAVVVTDFEGPRHAWSANVIAGRATLDGIRAAVRSGPGLAGNATPVGLMGYSGGGYATASAAEQAPTYAPELNLKGATFGGAADLRLAGMNMDGGLFAGLFLGAIVGQSREYPELLPLFSDNGRAIATALSDMCGTNMTMAYPGHHVAEMTNTADPFNDPTVLAVLDRQKLGYQKPNVPIFMYHSVIDEIVPYDDAVALNGRYCSLGTKVDFKTYYVSEHILTALSGAPMARAWLSDRFANLTAPSDCP